MSGRQFICERCKQAFISRWTDADAAAEARERFPTLREGDETFSVCDKCDGELQRRLALLTDEDKARMEADYRAGKR